MKATLLNCNRLASLVIWVMLMLLTTVACSKPVSNSDRDAQKQRALAAKEQLFKTLSGRLKHVIGSKGFVAAVDVCAHEASGIEARVAAQTGLRIGRTSAKLRNPANTEPAWAKTLIQATTTTSGQPTFVDLPNGELGALLPIRLKKMCENCHGDAEAIAQPVQTMLAQYYPNDRATGYREGDLRGWFWIEVPRM